MRQNMLGFIGSLILTFICCLGAVFVGTGLTYIITSKEWWWFGVAGSGAVLCTVLVYINVWIEQLTKNKKDKNNE